MAKPKPQVIKSFPAWITWTFAALCLLLVSLFVYNRAIDVTLVPKFMVLSVIVIAMLLIFLILSRHKLPEMSLLYRLPVWIWGVFMLISALSLLIAMSPYEGVFDVIRIFLSFLFLIITTSLLIRSGSARPFVVVSILLGLALASIGLFEYFTHVFRHPDMDALYQVKGLMSHKNIFSAMAYMTIPLLYYALLTAGTREKSVAVLVLGLILLMMLLLQTRSIWLATAVFMMVSLILVMVFRQGMKAQGLHQFKRNIVLLAIVHIMAFGSAYLINQYSLGHPAYKPMRSNAEAIQGLEKRVASIFDTQTANRQKRVSIWRNTLEMIKEKPLTGVGAGNWKILIPKYYQPNPNESYFHNWRRPHNDFLWVLAEKGIIGFITYAAFFISLWYIALRTLRRSINEHQKVLVILMIAGITGYGVDASFSFPYERIDLQMMLMLLASLLLWSYHQVHPIKAGVKIMNRTAFILMAMVLLSTGMFIGRKMVKAEVYTNYAFAAHKMQDWATAVVAIDRGYSEFGQLDPSNIPLFWFRGNANLSRGNLREARMDLGKAIEQNPYSVPSLSDLGTVHYYLQEYEKAIPYFERAIKIYPLHRYSIQKLGECEAALGKYKQALDHYYLCLTDQYNQELDTLIHYAQIQLYGVATPVGVHP